jgi:uncharacterized repeat protein (TIGR01451 family)
VTDGLDCCVPVPNDVAVSISDTPDPAVVGGPLTYTITVVNTGPATANGVTVVDVLPPSFNLQSLNVSPPVGLNGRGTSGGGTINLGSSGITRGFFIGWFEGTGKKTKELLKWKPG